MRATFRLGTCGALLVMSSGGAACAPAAVSPSSEERATPWEGQPIVVTVRTNAPLFPEELSAPREETSTFLRRHGFRVVPDAEIEAVRRMATEHRARADGPVCRRAPSFATLLGAAYGTRPRAHLFLDGAVAGTLAVLTVLPPDGASASETRGYTMRGPEGPAMYSMMQGLCWLAGAPKKPAAVDDWTAIFAELAPPRPPGKVVQGLARDAVRIGLESSRISINEAITSGDWSSSPPRPDDFREVLPALDACHDLRLYVHASSTAVLAVGDQGNVERCFIAPDDERPYAESAAPAACACAAWSRMRFPAVRSEAPANAKRRVAISVSNRVDIREIALARDATSATFFDVRAAPRDYDARWALEDTLLDVSSCAKRHPNIRRKPGTETRAAMRLTVDGTGHAADVRLELDGAPELARCVAGVLAAVPFPCTTTGEPVTVEATFGIIGG